MIRQTRGDTGAESEGLLGMVADRDGQHSQKCPPPRGSEYQTGSNNDKGTAEESVIEMNKSAVNEEESCAKNHHGWKGFNLKRQLSKVDLKIKSTFSPALLTSQNGVLVCFFVFFHTLSPSFFFLSIPYLDILYFFSNFYINFQYHPNLRILHKIITFLSHLVLLFSLFRSKY